MHSMKDLSILRNLLYVAAISMLLTGCSHTKNLWSSNDVPTVEVIVEPMDNNRSDNREYASVRMERSRNSVNPSEEVAAPIAPTIIMRPEMTFGSTESSHVKIPAQYNDPFPESSIISLNLDEMSEEFHYPYKGKLLSPYGMRGRSMHTGIDIKCIPNDTIRAAMSGVVRMSKLYSSYGYIIVIRHYNGLETVYAHNSKNLVKVNDIVEKGQPISLAGRTGRATTEHLHFEIRAANEPLDPAIFVDPENQRIRNGSVYLHKNGSRVLAYTSVNPDVLLADLGTAIPETTLRLEPSQSEQYHTIKKGETLSLVARTYSTTVSKICSLNNIQTTKILRIGEKIRVR